MDRISELPDDAIVDILERLPIRDAVRTSILSRIWKYKWTTRSTLSMNSWEFHENDETLPEDDEMFPGVVKTILSQHNGPLHKFDIFIPRLGAQAIAEFTPAICVALIKGVQELTVRSHLLVHVLPSFLFSCGEQLTELKLKNCEFNPPPGFTGFSNLKTFYLYFGFKRLHVSFAEELSSFVSSCPKLRKVVLGGLYSSHDLNFRIASVEDFYAQGSFRSILFEEAPNLVSLTVFDSAEIEKRIPSNDYMLQLFSNMAKIKYLSLGDHMCRLLGTDCAPRKHSTILQNLKTIEVSAVDLGSLREFHCILSLIMSSPKLHRIQIYRIQIEDDMENLDDPNVEAWGYKGCCFRHLQSVRMTELRGSDAELKLIEILLANSPLLQNLSTELELGVNKASFSEKLMQFPRASPIAHVSCITKKMYHTVQYMVDPYSTHW